MEEKRLPVDIRNRASVSAGGEHAWRAEDVEDVLLAARAAGLACLGGQPQFQVAGATYEPYWLNFDPVDRRVGESWNNYVSRSCSESLAAFHELRRTVDFREEARRWDSLRHQIDAEQFDPIEGLWFVLYFQAG